MASLGDHLRIWDCNSWTAVGAIPEFGHSGSGVRFHPNGNQLAAVSENGTRIVILGYDTKTLLLNAVATSIIKYSNAKVVLVGDSGVGKSGLGFALAEPPFRPTDSTHGRHVWTLDQKQVILGSGVRELREILLWDLAGQPGYRLVHQLHLNEVSVALVVFDSRSETDPFTGVRHWVRSLRVTRKVRGNSNTMTQFLIAARTDRGGVSVSDTRIQKVREKFGFDAYLATSAKEGWGVSELNDAIKNAINWAELPKVSSTDIFQDIKTFIVEQKKSGRILITLNELYDELVSANPHYREEARIREQFETCIKLVESRDLIKRISFGSFVLLQPELLDAYASAMINAARDEPDGLGCIAEEDVRNGRFPIPSDMQIEDKAQETVLLIATTEDMLAHEIAIRDSVENVQYLVFPSQLTRENNELTRSEGNAVIFEFEGPVQNIYATLSVRLSRSGVFERSELWKNATTFVVRGHRGICGFAMREVDEGKGELAVFYDGSVEVNIKNKFESYIELHVQRNAIPDSIVKKRAIICSKCGFVVPEQMKQQLARRKVFLTDCPICKNTLELRDLPRLRTPAVDTSLPTMDRMADARRDLDTASVTLRGKMATNDFDVFLCHNSNDKTEVRAIAERLKVHGIYPWFDEWNIRPGSRWQKELEKQIQLIKSAAVFVGKKGLGPWQDVEQEALISQFVTRKCPIIPVVLGSCRKRVPALPPFLKAMHMVDFRREDPDPLKQLIWGITGKQV
jgi:GTPase SAR1 family protein